MLAEQMINGRYQVVSRVGGGGTALVYKARDTLLNRNVAIKILRQQFVHDEEFVRRFQREAQSAASLSHPNVVSIYDVGRVEDTHYIVMEYVEGQNLNEIIKERAPLQVEEAVRIASQICDALDHAHNNQIIHRDIKPHNIMIGKNGRVKVADFGIARAVSSSTITQTGSVIGSVHYFSPEHARGTSTGEKSDLYSLGIVLYEMLTGKLPFLGESPISVALKHLSENVEHPRNLNAMIPQSLENIILKALRKDPGERYQSAGEMLDDLETCLQRTNEPKIRFLFNEAGENGGNETDEESTLVMPAIRSDEAGSFKKQDEDKIRRNKKKKWVKPTVWAGASLFAVFAIWLGIQGILHLFYVPDVTVPDVRELTLDKAEKQLADVGLLVEKPVIYQYKDDVAKDVVFDQDKINSKVKVNSKIKLYVSKGPEQKNMPNLMDKNVEEARSELMALGISKERITTDYIFSDKPPETIVNQTPGPDETYVPAEASVTLIVSKGRETFEMPNLYGRTLNEAKTDIIQKDLNLPEQNIKREKSYTPEGQVFKQFPEPKVPVSSGQEVTIYVSSGYPDDALEYTLNVAVEPETPGEETKVRIVVNDARGDGIEWLAARDIKETVTFPVKLVMSKTKDATVQIYKNDELKDVSTVTYKQVKKERS